MMKSGLFVLFTLFLCIFFSCSDSGQSPAKQISVPEADLETGNISVQQDQAIVVFTSGDVNISRETGWQLVEVGDFVYTDQTLKLGSDSFCELQFGEKAVVQVEENSEITIADLLLKSGESKIEINATAGTVLCKVQKLAKKERFAVRTRTAVCGVRGTEFGVIVSDKRDTILAVKEGKVAVLPASVDVAKLKGNNEESGEVIEAVIEQIEESAPVVEANQEIIIDETVVKATEEEFRKVETEIEKISQKEEVTQGELDNLNKVVALSAKTMNKAIKAPTPVSAKRKEKLKKIESIKIHSIPVLPPQDDIPKATKKEVRIIPSLVKIEIDTVPADARISLNNSFIAKGKFQGLYPIGDILRFSVEKDGFQAKAVVISVQKDMEKRFKVELEKIIQKEEGKSDLESGMQKDVSFTTEEDTQKTTAAVDSAVHKKELPIVTRKNVTNAAFIGDIAVHGNSLIAADKNGKIFAVSAEGKILWEFQTANNPNYNSSPHLFGSNIVFSGSRELVALNATNGSLIYRIPLDNVSSHMYGRYMIESGQFGLLPTDKTIRIIDLGTGAVVNEFNVPGDSRMTPALFKNKICIVNLTGRIQIIDTQTGEADSKPIVTNSVEPIALPMTVFKNRGYFAGRKNTVVCVDLIQKRVLWERKIQSASYTYSKLISNESGVFVYAGNNVFGFSQEGKVLFEPVGTVSAPPLYDNGNLYMGTTGGELIVVSSQTGLVQKSLDLDNVISARPQKIGRHIALAAENGEIIIINPKAL